MEEWDWTWTAIILTTWERELQRTLINFKRVTIARTLDKILSLINRRPLLSPNFEAWIYNLQIKKNMKESLWKSITILIKELKFKTMRKNISFFKILPLHNLRRKTLWGDYISKEKQKKSRPVKWNPLISLKTRLSFWEQKRTIQGSKISMTKNLTFRICKWWCCHRTKI